VTESIGPIRPVGRSQTAKEARQETAGANSAAQESKATQLAAQAPNPAAIAASTLRPAALTAVIAGSLTANALRARIISGDNGNETGTRSASLSLSSEDNRVSKNGIFAFGKVNALSKREQRRRRLRNAFEFAFSQLVAEEDLASFPVVRPNFFIESRGQTEEIELIRVLRKLLMQYQAEIDRENLVNPTSNLKASDFIRWLSEVVDAFKESVDWIVSNHAQNMVLEQSESLNWVDPVSEALAASLSLLGAKKTVLNAESKAVRRFPTRFDKILEGIESEKNIRTRARRCDAWTQFLVALSQIRMLVLTTAIASP
jgi:hypothetical protein